MLGLNSIEWATHGRDLAALWARVPLAEMSVVLLYWTFTLVLWWAPVYGWLLLVSVWARRAPFLWAVLPPLGLALCEKLAFNTNHVLNVILTRLAGTYEEAFAVNKGAVQTSNGIPTLGLEQIDPGKFLATPGLWIGLILAAAFVVATVWLRRNREPL
jgi:ABC-2 type transport system permease protein